MVSDAKKTKRPRSAVAQNASSEPKPKKAKVASTKKSSIPAPAAAQAVPAAAQAAMSDEAAKATTSSTPAPAAAHAVPAAAQAAMSDEAAQLKALFASLRKASGLVLSDRKLDDACAKLGLSRDGTKIVKVNRVRNCVNRVPRALEDAFIEERVSQEAASKKARKAKKKGATPTTQAKDKLRKPAKTKSSPTPTSAVLANAERPTTSDAMAATTQDEVEQPAQGPTPDAKPSAWFPAPDLTSNFLDDEEAFDKAMRHNIKFTMADAREICGELQPPGFREALGPLADLRRKIDADFQFRIPGPPVDENDGITLGAPSQQE